MKVQYKSEKSFAFGKRYVWYRKDLSDMPWWKRMFIRNPWRKVYRSYTVCFPDRVEDCFKVLFDSYDANKIAEKYKTVEELEVFLSEEKSKAERMFHEAFGDWRF